MIEIDKVKNTIIEGDALQTLKGFPSNSIDCIITSPPYWSLRDYSKKTNKIWGGVEDCQHEWGDYIKKGISGGTKSGKVKIKDKNNFQIVPDNKQSFCKKCGAFYGQLGLEPSLELYLQHLLEITKELKRVLKKTGVMFWNHGDAYGGNKEGGALASEKTTLDWGGGRTPRRAMEILPKIITNFPSKSLCLQNYRLIMKMTDEQKWFLRDIIVWVKKVYIKKLDTTFGNAMPSSVRDRCSFSYEPIFMLTKSKNYWFDLDALRVKHKWADEDKRSLLRRVEHKTGKSKTPEYQGGFNGVGYHPLGANRPNVWQIDTQALAELHFASFPPILIEDLIKAGCPRWVCKECGFVKKRITQIFKTNPTKNISEERLKEKQKGFISQPLERYETIRQTIGWASCSCREENKWRSGIVLDPFMGSGTTALCCAKMNIDWIGIELNPDYIKIANKRIADYKNKLEYYDEQGPKLLYTPKTIQHKEVFL